jgi:hypothetical protein
MDLKKGITNFLWVKAGWRWNCIGFDNPLPRDSHAEMKKASSSFRYGAGSLPKTVLPYLPTGVPVDLTLVATAFFQLQEARHEADYNLAPRYSREEAEQVVALAETAFAAWKRVRATPEARVYLLSILFWSRWNR